MSIHKIINKIKGVFIIDRFYLMILLIIIGVSLASFSLGRLSILNHIDEIRLLEQQANVVNTQEYKETLVTEGEEIREKRFIASKNGKMYYSLGCSGINRINIENRVYFNSEIEAEKAGYTKSKTCK
jgi:hypothetical protein